MSPSVSVIIPMYQEEGFIGACLDGFVAQTYPNVSEILVIDGGSTDGGPAIVEQHALVDPRIRLLDNPRRLAAAAANIGIAESTGELLCFLSSHGVPDPEYVEVAVRVLQRTGAAGVGGVYEHVGLDAASSAIGLAMASPFGMASPHRSALVETEVDTISHPVFVKQALVNIGGYDETLLRNEDYETNYRLRRNGGSLVFTPEMSSVYRPRHSLRALGRQFYDYGYWKAEVIIRHPASVRPRHLVPPAAVVGTAVLAIASVVGSVRPWARRAAAIEVVGYAVLLAAAVRHAEPARHDADTAHFVGALPVIHGAWGAGVVMGLAGAVRRRR